MSEGGPQVLREGAAEEIAALRGEVSSIFEWSFALCYTGCMRMTAQVKLMTTPEEAVALKETLSLANAACDAISEWAWEHRVFKQYSIHRGCYVEMRSRFSLSSQVIVRCIAKVADAYKLDKKTKRTFKPLGSIAYDDRILTFFAKRGRVSIWTVAGRLSIPFVCGERQAVLLQSRQGESDLLLNNGTFYLLATCSLDDPEPIDVEGVLGVDMGIVNIATDSEGESFSGESVKAYRRRMKRLRSGLQKCGTKNAKRHLMKLRKKEARHSRDVNHSISKKIVKKALLSRKAIALEDLTGIRERSNGFSREVRWLMGGWSFHQLGAFLVYKATMAGIPVCFVDARNTSRTCSECGHCEKANRKSQDRFKCLQCGFDTNADLNAAVNIGARAVVNPPMASSLAA